MSKIHLLAGNGGTFNVVGHIATPAGNNSAGFPWASCLVSAGMNKTIMTIGSGFGQISTTEANSVAAGTLIETRFQWTETPGMDVPTLQADLDNAANTALGGRLDILASQLKYYGYTQG